MKRFENFNIEDIVNEKHTYLSSEIRGKMTLINKMKNENRKPYLLKGDMLEELVIKTPNTFPNNNTRIYFLEENKANTYNSVRKKISEFISQIDYICETIVYKMAENDKDLNEYIDLLMKIISIKRD